MISGIFKSTDKVSVKPDGKKKSKKKKRIVNAEKDKDEKIQEILELCKLCERHVPVIFY